MACGNWRGSGSSFNCLHVGHSAQRPRADYLLWIAAEHPDLREMREICGHSSITECLSTVLDHSRSLPDRAVAAWFCSGINYPYQHRVGAGDLAGLADAYCRLGVPPDLVAATMLAAK